MTPMSARSPGRTRTGPIPLKKSWRTSSESAELSRKTAPASLPPRGQYPGRPRLNGGFRSCSPLSSCLPDSQGDGERGGERRDPEVRRLHGQERGAGYGAPDRRNRDELPAHPPRREEEETEGRDSGGIRGDAEDLDLPPR